MNRACHYFANGHARNRSPNFDQPSFVWDLAKTSLSVSSSSSWWSLAVPLAIVAAALASTCQTFKQLMMPSSEPSLVTEMPFN